MKVGVYDRAQEYSLQSPVRPGLSVIGDNSVECDSGLEDGTFAVLEAVFGDSGSVDRLAVNFSLVCIGGGQASGVLRLNS